MKRHALLWRWINALAFLAVPAAAAPSWETERVVTRTNLAERWITNAIEVRMPRNLFVDEFHTNWFRQYYTNVADVYATNWLTETLTNIVPIRATRSVHETEYKTNWHTVTLTNEVAVEAVRTNFVNQWRTNWRTVSLTREVGVEVPRTNLVPQWRTNWKTFTLTNWQTVLIMKTNWYNQPVTNVVSIDLFTNPAAAPQAAATSPSQPLSLQGEDAVPLRGASPTDELRLEAARTGRAAANNVAEVQLRVHWTKGAGAPLAVRQWRVESETGAILCSGQDQEFKRELPVGRYRVEVKAQKNTDSPILAARAILALSAAEAVILPRALPR